MWKFPAPFTPDLKHCLTDWAPGYRINATPKLTEGIHPLAGGAKVGTGFAPTSRSKRLEPITVYDFGFIQSKIIVI